MSSSYARSAAVPACDAGVRPDNAQPARPNSARILEAVDEAASPDQPTQPRELRIRVQRWLDWLCRMVAGVHNGGVFLTAGQADGRLYAAALWPDSDTKTAILRKIASEAVTRGAGVSQKINSDQQADVGVCDYLALPVVQDEHVVGAVALTLSVRSEPQLQAVLQLLQWGTLWLEDVINEEARQRRAREPALLELISQTLRDTPVPVAAHDLCDVIAERFDCARVALGMVKGLHVRVIALSHQLRFDRRLARVAEQEAAMEECLDQGRMIMFPAVTEDATTMARAHAEMSQRSGDKAICTLPLLDAGRIIGIIALQAKDDAALDEESLALLNEAADMVGPLIALRQRDTQPLWRKSMHALRMQAMKLLGPGYLRFKTVTVAMLLSFLLLSFVPAEYRIAARSTVEGVVQQAIVAPQIGFIATAKVRAGDLVQTGDVLATLDARDLLLEIEKWRSEYDKHAKEHREAVATRDRARGSVLAARMAQAEVQLHLVQEQLKRTTLRAPFSGVVVSGDLSRSLGTPVERGQVLFEIAPLDGYRVVLSVDEHDVAALERGQRGHLRLTGFPDRPIDLTLKRILPIAVADDGGNFFRVEAEVQDAPGELRPGMQGVAKIGVGQGSLLWVWTHNLIDRLRLWAWSVGF